MLQAGFDAMWCLSLAIGISAVVSVAWAIGGRWLLARKLARASVFGTLALLSLGVFLLIFGLGYVADPDPASKAGLLAEFIICALNGSLIVLPSIVAAVVVWILSNKRLPGP